MPNLTGITVADRFRLGRVIGKGGMAAVYEAVDTSGRRFAVKVFANEVAAKFPQYTDHLRSVRSALHDPLATGLLIPIEVGVTNQFAFEVFRLIEEAKNLAIVLEKHGGVSLKTSLKVISRVATALSTLHSAEIIHADVKPTNILIAGDVANDQIDVYLTDLGMARPIRSEGDVLLVGTYAYMHPALRGSFGEQTKMWFAKKRSASTAVISRDMTAPSGSVSVGPYIDLYALGVVFVQAVTGPSRFSIASSEQELISRFSTHDSLTGLPDELKTRLVRLAYRLLFVEPGTALTAEQIAREATELHSFVAAATPAGQPSNVREPAETVTSLEPDIRDALSRLESVSESLTGNTIVGITTGRSLSVLSDQSAERNLLTQVSAVFTNALKRTKNVWVITVAMTICSFALIVCMIVLAVTLAVYTGKSHWALIFGGASVPLILGTLVWRPFDRIFRSTILTQQLEMIHLQTMAGFSATHDLNKRVKICRDAFIELTLLFDKHANSEQGGKEKSVTRRKKRY